MSETDDVRALSERLTKAFEQEDYETMRECCAPDMVVWYCYQKKDLTLEDMIRQGKELLEFARPGSMQIHDVRKTFSVDGWLHQMQVRLTTVDGEEVRVDECLLYQVADGRVTRLEQYNDWRDLEPLVKHLPAEKRY